MILFFKSFRLSSENIIVNNLSSSLQYYLTPSNDNNNSLYSIRRELKHRNIPPGRLGCHRVIYNTAVDDDNESVKNET